MLNIRPSVFETNSSSGDYYNEPDYVDYFSLDNFPTEFKIILALDDFSRKCIEYFVNSDFDKIKKVIDESGDYFSVRSKNITLKDDRIIVSINVTINGRTESKRGFKDHNCIESVFGFANASNYDERDEAEIKEFKEYLNNSLIELIDDNKKELCSNFDLTEEEFEQNFDKMILKVEKFDIPEITMDDVNSYYGDDEY